MDCVDLDKGPALALVTYVTFGKLLQLSVLGLLNFKMGHVTVHPIGLWVNPGT